MNNPDSSTDGTAQLDGKVHCPHCGYWGEEYDEEKNLTGQFVLVCLKCGGVQ